MNKRFIILIDFSKYSSNLIEYACSWGKNVSTEILLLHQTQMIKPALTDAAGVQKLSQSANYLARKKLKALAKKLIPESFNVYYRVSDNHLESTLTKLLAEPFENLIFVGLKGTGLLKQIFLGSVAVQVIDSSKNIVVAMPKEIKVFSHKRIFVAISEKHHFNILELNNFLKFIDKENTLITFFHLAKPNEKKPGIEKYLRQVSEMFSHRFNTDFAIYEGYDPFNDIKKVINNQVDDILVIQKGSRLFTDQLFRKFLINTLIYEGQTPLVVLP